MSYLSFPQLMYTDLFLYRYNPILVNILTTTFLASTIRMILISSKCLHGTSRVPCPALRALHL